MGRYHVDDVDLMTYAIAAHRAGWSTNRARTVLARHGVGVGQDRMARALALAAVVRRVLDDPPREVDAASRLAMTRARKMGASLGASA